MPATSAPVRILTPRLFAALTRVSTTSIDLCDSGKALSPLSTTAGIPSFLKKSMRPCGVRFWNEARSTLELALT